MLANDMENITKNIMGSYETRINFVKGLVSDTAEMLGKFSKEHTEMSKSLRNKLQMDFKNLQTTVGEFISDKHHQNQQLRKETLQMLSNHEDIRLSEASALKESLRQFVNQVADDIENLLTNFAKVRKQMASDQKKSLNDFTNQLVKETTDMLKNFSEAHSQMASALKEMLSSDNFSRKAEVAEFMKDITKSHQAMAKDLNNFLTGSENDRKSQFTEMMNTIKEDISEMSKAWSELVMRMHTLRSIGIEKAKEMEEAEKRRIEKECAEAERKQLEQEEAERRRIEKERAEAEKKRLEQEAAERKQRELEETEAMILKAVKKNALKLSEIGSELGKAWQGLIPIMTELINDGKLSKDKDGIYHIV